MKWNVHNWKLTVYMNPEATRGNAEQYLDELSTNKFCKNHPLLGEMTERGRMGYLLFKTRFEDEGFNSVLDDIESLRDVINGYEISGPKSNFKLKIPTERMSDRNPHEEFVELMKYVNDSGLVSGTVKKSDSSIEIEIKGVTETDLVNLIKARKYLSSEYELSQKVEGSHFDDFVIVKQEAFSQEESSYEYQSSRVMFKDSFVEFERIDEIENDVVTREETLNGLDYLYLEQYIRMLKNINPDMVSDIRLHYRDGIGNEEIYYVSDGTNLCALGSELLLKHKEDEPQDKKDDVDTTLEEPVQESLKEPEETKVPKRRKKLSRKKKKLFGGREK